MFIEAKLISRYSDHPIKKVGAIIEYKGKVFSQGYNIVNKTHAEAMAIHSLEKAPRSTTMWLYGLPPCLGCAKLIVASKVKYLNIYVAYELGDWEKSCSLAKEYLKENNVILAE